MRMSVRTTIVKVMVILVSLSNSNTFYFYSHHHNLRPQIVSGVACIFCGLLQGQTDPDLKNLQVEEHDVFFWSDNIIQVEKSRWRKNSPRCWSFCRASNSQYYSNPLRCSSPSLASLELLPPSPLSTSTPRSSSPQLLGEEC